MTNKSQSKKHEPQAEAIIDVEATSSSSDRPRSCVKNNSWNVSKLFWGLLLIVAGGLMLASNFGLVDLNWGSLWRLWPLIIVSVGLSVLSFDNIIWKILVVILTISTVGFIAWVAVSDSLGEVQASIQEKTINVISKEVKKAEINVKAGASELQINSANQSALAKARLESNLTTLSTNSTINGDTQQVDFLMNSVSDWWTGGIRNNLSIEVNRDIPLKLSVKAGASNTQIDMSRVRLTDLSLDSGASNLDVKLGSIQDSVSVKIDSGASSIKLRIPKEVGVQLKVDGGLNTKTFEGLSEISEDVYQSENYVDAKKQINVAVKTGVSTIKVEKY